MSEKEKNIVVNEEPATEEAPKDRMGFVALIKAHKKAAYPCWSKYSYDYRCCSWPEK